MAFDKSRYEKLTNGGLLIAQEVYVSEEHLLVIEGLFNERYRRIHYKDIQALLSTRSPVGLVLGIIFGLLGILFLSFTIGLNTAPEKIIFAILTLLCVFGVIVQIHGRGSAAFGIQTAVQTVRLYSVNNVRKVERAENILIDKIETVQGQLTREALQAALQAEKERVRQTVSPPSMHQPPPIPTVSKQPPPLTPPASESPSTQ